MSWDEAGFRRLVRGETRGLVPAALRGALRCLSLPYAAAAAARNAAFDLGLRRPADLGVPVVGVGNLTTGGTGKTPLVADICRRLRALGRRPGVLSRGYGAGPGAGNDEAAVLALHLPDVPHAQGRDRAALGRRMVADRRADVLVLDDGFQRRQVARALDIVLLDATDPWGTALLPRGFRREPLRSLRRAGLLILTRADLVEAAVRTEIRRTAARHAPTAGWAEVAFVADGWTRRDPAGFFGPAEAPRQPFAFCGVGNPEAFFRTLAAAGIFPIGTRTFPDHHPYFPADLAALELAADAVRAEAFAVTEKDAVKLGGTLAGRPVLALRIAPRFLAGADRFAAALAQAINPLAH